jgi:hypothetical protein
MGRGRLLLVVRCRQKISACWVRGESGPASSPTRAKTRPAPFRAAPSASGSLSTFSSRTTAPAPSTMQILLVSSETSIPA